VGVVNLLHLQDLIDHDSHSSPTAMGAGQQAVCGREGLLHELPDCLDDQLVGKTTDGNVGNLARQSGDR
jgi:hypothetical protein